MPGRRERTSATAPARNGRPPPQVDDAADQGGYECGAGDVDGVVEPVLDLLGEHENGDGQQKVPPEQPAEHLRVVAGVLVVPRVFTVSA